MSALLDAALGYAARGIPVYPIHWPRPNAGGASLACSCPRGRYCDRPAKHPLVWHGVKDASCDPAQPPRKRRPLPLAPQPGPGAAAGGPRGAAGAAGTPAAASPPEPARPAGGAGPPLRDGSDSCSPGIDFRTSSG